MKKIIAMLLVMVLALSLLTACGGKTVMVTSTLAVITIPVLMALMNF